MGNRLRIVNYLSPGLPAALFEGVAGYLGRSLGLEVTLVHETRFSGPPRGEVDPFSSSEADAAFMCAPPFFWCVGRGAPAELLGVAPVFDDPRAAGRPVYFADVITRAGFGAGSAATFADLRGGVWAYNDPCSLSGLYGLLGHLQTLGENETFFRNLVVSGSHRASLELVLNAQADAATVDSNVLRLWLGADPDLRRRLDVLTSWGPFPVQPLVVHSGLDADLKHRLRELLLSLNVAELPELKAFGLTGFASVDAAFYALEAERLKNLSVRERGLAPYAT